MRRVCGARAAGRGFGAGGGLDGEQCAGCGSLGRVGRVGGGSVELGRGHGGLGVGVTLRVKSWGQSNSSLVVCFAKVLPTYYSRGGGVVELEGGRGRRVRE